MSEQQGVPERILDRIRSVVTIERIYGQPVERNGVTVIPAAALVAGGGGGGGSDENGTGGEGGGFGAVARPVGAIVIDGSNVRWQPAFDVTRLSALATVILLAYRFGRRRS